MTVVTRWWWVRHAPVESGGRIYGYGDHDLAANLAAAPGLPNLAASLPDAGPWIVTPLQRTQQTAAALLQNRPDEVRPQIEPDLAEQHFGTWQGLTYAELDAHRDQAWHRFWTAPAHETPPGGESFETVIRRVAGAVERLNAAHAGEDIVAVTHGGTIRAALALALGLPAEKALAFSVEPCSLTRLDHIAGSAGSHDTTNEGAGVWRVVEVNRPFHR